MFQVILEKYEDEATYKNAGALKEPDFEAIAAMNPDVIFHLWSSSGCI